MVQILPMLFLEQISTHRGNAPACLVSKLLEVKLAHYANMSVQYTAIFHGCKNDNFQMKLFDIFLFLLKTKIVGTR